MILAKPCCQELVDLGPSSVSVINFCYQSDPKEIQFSRLYFFSSKKRPLC